MEVLARIQAGGRAIACGLAITNEERAAVLAQRFRVYQRRGYYRAGLGADRDVYDTNAAYFLATLQDAKLGDVLLGSARLIFGESRAAFRFPAEQAFELELPRAVGEIPTAQRIEVSRVVAEAVHGIVIGGLLTPLGILHAIGEYARSRGARSGLGVIKQRLLRALQGAGVALHEIQPAAVIYPKDGPLSGYFYHSDPVLPVYWLAGEIDPSVERAIARHRGAGG
jgi:N-acyl-L-homoserine lactone synthetase